MTLTLIGSNSFPTYVALSTDILDNGTISGATLVGKTIYLTDTGDWKIILPNLKIIPFSFSNGTAGVLPEYVSAEIGAVSDDTIVLTLSENITGADYALGFTIKVNDVAVAIISVTRQAVHSVIYFVVSPVVQTDVVTIEYDDSVGGILSETGTVYLNAILPQTVTNNVITP